MIRVLLVDRDDASRRNELRSSLRDAGAILTTIRGSGFGRFRPENFDILILDLASDGSWKEHIVDARAAAPSLPILAVSSGCSDEAVALAIRLGASGHLRKPIDPLELRSRMTDWIAPRVRRAPGGPVDAGSGLSKLIAHVVGNQDFRIPLPAAAREAGMSITTFGIKFKAEMEENYVTFLNKLRIAKAVATLERSDLSMSEIAFACGFTNQYHFCRTFRKLTRTSPMRFRKRIASDPREKAAIHLGFLKSIFSDT